MLIACSRFDREFFSKKTNVSNFTRCDTKSQRKFALLGLESGRLENVQRECAL